MKKLWCVGYEECVIAIVETEADAAEMVMSFAAESAYETNLFDSIPIDWSYAKILRCHSGGYWIEEVPVL